jgi:hypothetical protein
MRPQTLVIPVEIKTHPRRYAYRTIPVYNNLGAYQRFLDEANELGYNIISVGTLSDWTMVVTYEATHETETEDDDKSDSN